MRAAIKRWVAINVSPREFDIEESFLPMTLPISFFSVSSHAVWDRGFRSLGYW